jgi:hypothetical protein
MKSSLSPGAIVRALSDVARRFPLAVASIVALAVLLLVAIHAGEKTIDQRWWVFLPVVLFASVALRLALEERRPMAGLLAGLAAAALWGVRCVMLPANLYDLATPQTVEIGAVMATAFFAIFFAAFLRRDTDAEWWNFASRTIARLLLGAIFANILYGGFWLAIYAVGELFSMTPPGELSGDLAVACFVVFAPLYVLAGVPSGALKHDRELVPSHLLKVLALYIMGSILAVYTLILYLYLLKIVFTWELPNGWVSWLVTLLGAGGLVVTLLLHPHRMRGGDRIAEFLGRWTGVVIAPLLILMSVGIARRVSDYGWTPNRCYILLLNMWFYGVYLWLFVIRGRRVKWIVISAVAVGFLSSVGPWSLARVTPREDAEGDPSADAGQKSEWFSSDNTITYNIPLSLGQGYENFASISWHSDDSVHNGTVEFSLQGGDLMIRPSDESGEFRVPLRQAADRRVVRGEGFALVVTSCTGTRYPESDSIAVEHLKGYLLY